MSPVARKYASAGLLVLAVAALLAPFGIIAGPLSVILHEPEEAIELLSSLTALLAVSLIFLDIVTGSFRPLLDRCFDRAHLQNAHTAFGIAGFGFALTHFLLLLPQIGGHYSESNRVLFVFGPVALALLGVTILTALFMKRIGTSWRAVHLLNYLIFGMALAHGLVIGEERSMPAMRVLFILFGAVALAGLIFRAAQPQWRLAVAAGLKGGKR